MSPFMKVLVVLVIVALIVASIGLIYSFMPASSKQLPVWNGVNSKDIPVTCMAAPNVNESGVTQCIIFMENTTISAITIPHVDNNGFLVNTTTFYLGNWTVTRGVTVGQAPWAQLYCLGYPYIPTGNIILALQEHSGNETINIVNAPHIVTNSTLQLYWPECYWETHPE